MLSDLVIDKGFKNILPQNDISKLSIKIICNIIKYLKVSGIETTQNQTISKMLLKT